MSGKITMKAVVMACLALLVNAETCGERRGIAVFPGNGNAINGCLNRPNCISLLMQTGSDLLASGSYLPTDEGEAPLVRLLQEDEQAERRLPPSSGALCKLNPGSPVCIHGLGRRNLRSGRALENDMITCVDSLDMSCWEVESSENVENEESLFKIAMDDVRKIVEVVSGRGDVDFRCP